LLVLTSWDDGHPHDLRVAELLAKHGLAGTFFVPGENREGRTVMESAELRRLDQGFEIGGHTLTHRYLTRDTGDDVISLEIAEGKRLIEEQLGHPITGFCYPGGRADRSVTEAVRSSGFSYARTIENLRFDLGENRWRIPTTLQFFPHGVVVLAKNALRYPAVSKLPTVLRRIHEKDFVEFVVRSAELCAKSGGVFHLWGHSWEVEQHQLWQSLETVLRCLGGLASRSVTLAEAMGFQGVAESSATTTIQASQ
jgi:hypothetical protein